MRNTFWRGKLGRKIGLSALAVGLCFAAWGIYTVAGAVIGIFNSLDFTRALAEAARRTPEFAFPTDVRAYLQALPSMGLFGLLLMLVLTSFSTVLSSLYLSGDIDMLLVAPVPMRAVFVVKFFGGLLVPYLLLLVFAAPAMLGFGRGMGYGAAYYVMSLLILVTLPLLPFSIGALLVMAVVRVIPARRAREIVGILGGMVGIVWFIGSQFSRQISNQVSSVETLGWLQRLNNPLLPSAWAGRALNAAGEGQWAALFGWGSLFLAVSIGAFLLALVLGERVYYEGWSNMATQGGKPRSKNREARSDQQSSPERPSVFGGLWSFLPPESAAILFKDLRVFPRDLRNLQQTIFPLAIAGIWTFNLIANGPQDTVRIPGAASSLLNLLFPAAISVFICLSLSSALGGPNISREGKGFWQLKLAPISGWRILLGKFVLAYAPYPTVGTLFILLISALQRSRLQDMLAALVLVQLLGLGLCAITLGLGAAFPKFNWEKPSDQTTFRAGCLSQLSYLLYLGLALGAALGLPLLGTFFPAWQWVFTGGGWLLAIGLTAAVTWGFLQWGASRLDQIEVG